MKTKFFAIALFSFTYIISLQAQKLEATNEKALLNVTVSNKAGKPLEKEEVSFVGLKDKKVYKGITDSQGKFSILVPIGDTYEIHYKDFTEETNYSQIIIPEEKGIYIADVIVTFEPAKSFTLKNVEFDLGKATLRPTSFKALNDLVEVMKMKDKMEIEIAGHTDNIGSEESNMKLSQARAEAVRNYLISKGIKPERITAIGYGDTQPIAYNTNPDGSDNPAGRQQNRRTEARITKAQ